MPPRWPLKFLEWFCPSQLYETISGDLLEKFEEDAAVLGLKKAQRNFIWNVLRFFRPGIIFRHQLPNSFLNTQLLGSFIKSAGRNIWKYRTNSLVNVLGLTLGIVCTLIVALIIRYEVSFDAFHTKADNIYRVVRVSQVEGQTEYRTGVVYALPATLADEIPVLEEITVMTYQRNAQFDVSNAQNHTVSFREDEGCAFVDSSFFKVFDFEGTQFKWLAGNPESALKEPNTIVLTRSLAEKYFETPNVLDQTLKFEKMLDLKVTGVIEDLPGNTDFPFKALISYATFQQFQGEGFNREWNSVSDGNQCYLVLPSGVDQAEIERQIARIHASYAPVEISSMRSYKLQPLSEVHSDPRFGNFNLKTVTTRSLWALGIIGGFLLIMVCINFIILSTAHAITRSKDVGIRKVLGSTRWQVMGQSITETLLIIMVSITVAMMATTLILGQVQSLTRTEISKAIYADPFVWGCVALIALVISILAGWYPALLLSRNQPIMVIKNNFSSKVKHSITLREILLVTQFTIMQILIIATFIGVKQMHFFRNVDMGFNKEAVVNVEVPQGVSKDKLDAFQNDMLSSSAISEVSFSSSLPSGLKRPRWFWDIRNAGADKSEDLIFEYQSVDVNYLDLYDIELLAGRDFTKSSDRYQIIINETLASKLGFATPETAIDQQVTVMDETITIIGVIKDVYSNSLKNELDKIALMTWADHYRLASIKLHTSANTGYQDLPQTLAFIEQKWNRHFAGNVFSYSFLDDNVQAYYEEEVRLTSLFRVFSLIFIVIGGLGLYGLVSFLAKKRTKEVAVRKVLGAGISQILMLFSLDYIKQITIAVVLAIPVAYYFMNEWLNGFAHHISLRWWLFVLPGLFVLVLTLLSVSGITWRSAMANPTVSLRNE